MIRPTGMLLYSNGDVSYSPRSVTVETELVIDKQLWFKWEIRLNDCLFGFNSNIEVTFSTMNNACAMLVTKKSCHSTVCTIPEEIKIKWSIPLYFKYLWCLLFSSYNIVQNRSQYFKRFLITRVYSPIWFLVTYF